MNAVNATENLFASLGLNTVEAQSKATNDASELGLETFLKLMITQLNNQDPFKPMENGDFLGQIAQFGTVSGLDKLNNSFDGLAGSLTGNQALQASSLVGRQVLVPIEQGYLGAGGVIAGRVDLDASATNLTVQVSDAGGQLIRDLSLGTQQPGSVEFAWDGMKNDGSYAPPGAYAIRVTAERGDGSETLQSQLYSTVESVSLKGPNGLDLNLAGLGSLPLDQVNQIY
jgi:flagellar basal-body rod modification protein FlgD